MDSVLRDALHTNRWKQPALEQTAGDFLAKYLTGDPVRMYATFRIWNEYLVTRNIVTVILPVIVL